DLGDASGAESAFARAVAVDPAHARGWNNLAHARLDQGRLDEAEQALKRALAAQPDHALAFLNLARVERSRGNAELARKYDGLAEGLGKAP
ncbi:MAG TPA: tetratricopeptide repeat protein, partial [Usitatibacter sp.]